MNYRKKLAWLIAIATIVKIIVASTQEFGNVEAYYWVLSTKLQWNYFDHPPVVAWLIRLTTGNLLIHNELFVRLGAIISSGICTWLMFKIGSLLYNERAGWYAALLYASSIYSGLSIAAFILPDSPQMVFWLASVYLLLKIIRSSPNHPRLAMQWLLFGIVSGLCIMTKVHGVFLWIGAASYFLLYDRGRLNNRYVYLAFAITLLIISPIFIWNLQNHFITYKYHSSRVSLAGGEINLTRFIKQLLLIIFSTGPIHIFLICSGLYKAVKSKLPLDKGALRLVLLCSLPLILILLFVSVFREVLPHWPGPALSVLFIVPAIGLAAGKKNQQGKIPGGLKFAIGYALFAVCVQEVSTSYFPGTLSKEQEGMKMGAGDETLDMYGWKLAGKKFDSLYKSDVAQKLMPANAPVIITNWIPGAHIDFYIAQPAGLQTYGLGTVYDLHQYFWFNNQKRPLLKGDSAYYIIPSSLFTYKAFNKVLDSFKGYNFASIFQEYRSGIVCKEYYFIRLNGYKGTTF